MWRTSSRRIEHEHAIKQGRLVARNMCRDNAFHASKYPASFARYSTSISNSWDYRKARRATAR